ncbi:unnamed protein product [Candida verbasci]|uniref:Bacteriophage T5 Orf172 DNA-binding domain-containing protein n=1 Tax=Candida verbasci TaxID=1227364 RepID=A0A9W4TYR0_9ASCO|nr:unnamed protein product [Candida verbasci]
MSNFIQPPHKNWSIQVKNLPDAKIRDKWLQFNNKSPYILVKIGMTTRFPDQRIKEWENKCNHKLINVGPRNKRFIYKQNFLERLSCLSIQDNYERYRDDGFFVNKNLKLVESSIHKALKDKYGKGDVYCSGCLVDKSVAPKKDSPFNTSYNVHTEWFLILKKEIEQVYNIIDSTCVNLG